MKDELDKVCIYLAGLEAWLKRLCLEFETIKKHIDELCRKGGTNMGERNG